MASLYSWLFATPEQPKALKETNPEREEDETYVVVGPQPPEPGSGYVVVPPVEKEPEAEALVICRPSETAQDQLEESMYVRLRMNEKQTTNTSNRKGGEGTKDEQAAISIDDWFVVCQDDCEELNNGIGGVAKGGKKEKRDRTSAYGDVLERNHTLIRMRATPTNSEVPANGTSSTITKAKTHQQQRVRERARLHALLMQDAEPSSGAAADWKTLDRSQRRLLKASQRRAHK